MLGRSAGFAVSACALVLLNGCGSSVPDPAVANADGAMPPQPMLPLPFGGLSAAASRGETQSLPFSLRDVPSVDLDASGGAVAPRSDELVADRTNGSSRVFLKLGPHTLGAITQNASSGAELYVSCDVSQPGEIEWETLTLRPDGGATYRVGRGERGDSCAVRGSETAVADALPVVPSLVYAVRRCHGACTANDPLTILMPALQAAEADELGRALLIRRAGLVRVDLPMRKGAAASFDGVIDGSSLTALLGRSGSWSSPNTLLTVGVDISQSASEDTPIAIAYFGIQKVAAVPPPEPTNQIDFD